MRSYKKLVEAQSSLMSGEMLLDKDIATGGIKRYYIFTTVEGFLKEQEYHRKHYYEIIGDIAK